MDAQYWGWQTCEGVREGKRVPLGRSHSGRLHCFFEPFSSPLDKV